MPIAQFYARVTSCIIMVQHHNWESNIDTHQQPYAVLHVRVCVRMLSSVQFCHVNISGSTAAVKINIILLAIKI